MGEISPILLWYWYSLLLGVHWVSWFWTLILYSFSSILWNFQPSFIQNFSTFYFLLEYACMGMLSCVWLSCDPMDPACQAPLSIFKARILEWVAFPPPGDIPNLGTEPASPSLAGKDSLALSRQGSPILEYSQWIMWLFSGAQQSDSAIPIHVSILSQTPSLIFFFCSFCVSSPSGTPYL